LCAGDAGREITTSNNSLMNYLSSDFSTIARSPVL
jgi:hypothetical protein